jgi:hypothetical protein
VIPPVSYVVEGEKTSPKWGRAFALGCGGSQTTRNELQSGPVALFGSPQRHALIDQAKAEGRTLYYGDHGLFRRHQYYRIAKDRLQPSGEGLWPEDRFSKLHWNRQPEWNREGTAIVVCPNSREYMAWFGLDAKAWTVNVVSELAKYTDRPVIVRWKTQAQARPLYTDLHGAWLCVVFSSASAVEALAAGVPVCTLAPWASTAHMGIQDLSQVERPVYPDMQARDQFLFNLAYSQWTLEEMARGVAWAHLNA